MNESESSDCPICIDKYNASTRKIVQCGFCNFSCCSQCTKKYLLDTSENAHCMNCRKFWDRKCCMEKLGITFLEKQYKTKTEELLFEKEKAMLPATQVYVEREIQAEVLEKEIQGLHDTIRQIIETIKQLGLKKNELLDIKGASQIERRQFVKPCKNGDCKGFLSTQWKCGICGKYTCNQCLELKDEDEHKCLQENLQSAKLINQETKNCPTCGVNIFKTEGCDQMFCTQCHTAFSWKTGRKEMGNIHNPHYFEWLRTSRNGVVPRNPGDIQCGREIDNIFTATLKEHFERLFHRSSLSVLFFLNFSRHIIHINRVEIPRFTVDQYHDNILLRKQYMRNMISEEVFKKLIQIKNKDIQKRTEICQVLGMYTACATDILYRLCDFLKAKTDMFQGVRMWLNNYNVSVVELDRYKKELMQLTDYTNDCFLTISKVYKCKLYSVHHQRNNLNG